MKRVADAARPERGDEIKKEDRLDWEAANGEARGDLLLLHAQGIPRWHQRRQGAQLEELVRGAVPLQAPQNDAMRAHRAGCRACRCQHHPLLFHLPTGIPKM